MNEEYLVVREALLQHGWHSTCLHLGLHPEQPEPPRSSTGGSKAAVEQVGFEFDVVEVVNHTS